MGGIGRFPFVPCCLGMKGALSTAERITCGYSAERVDSVFRECLSYFGFQKTENPDPIGSNMLKLISLTLKGAKCGWMFAKILFHFLFFSSFFKIYFFVSLKDRIT